MAALDIVPPSAWILPMPPTEPGALAQWYAQHIETIRAVDSCIYRAKRDMKARVVSDGPQVTSSGTVSLVPDGYDYNAEAVMTVMPALIKGAKLTASGDAAKVYRAESMLAEEFGEDLTMAVTGEVDAVEYNRVVHMKGPAAQKLDDAGCRTPRGRLAVR